ncbi:MAG: urease accessory protein UreE [Cyanobacteria bacterium P01_G01_bin.39]
MTEVAQIYLGNINQNPELAKLLSTATCLEVSLTASDRYKGRIHAYTDLGVGVGIIKDRDHALNSGDIFKINSEKLILINLQEAEVMVLDLSNLESHVGAMEIFNLGHVLGNHHYPIMIQEQKIYVQLVTNKYILEKLIEELSIPGLQFSYEIQSIKNSLNFPKHNHH